jgi:hypothetical protein
MVSARLARLALALYPLAYRRRYGAEMEALLEDQGPSAVAAADLLRGAARAHLRPESGLAAELGPDDRLKLGLGATLLAWVVFAVAGLALYKTTEGSSFTSAGDAHGLLGAAHLAIQVLALVGTAAVVLGAAPLVVAALRQVRERPAARRASFFAAGFVAVFLLATAALVAVAQLGSAPSDTLDFVILALWTGLAMACGIGCAVAGRLGLLAIEVPHGVLRFSAGCAVVVALGMVGIAVATTVYLAALAHDAPGLAGQDSGPLGILSVGASLGVQLAVMVAVSFAAGAFAVRGSRLRADTTGR